jgi:DNA-binding transcriptional ArsR family regulator
MTAARPQEQAREHSERLIPVTPQFDSSDLSSSRAKKGLTAVVEGIYNHLVVKPKGYSMTHSQRLDATFAALADPTRRAILARLASGQASVAELARPFAMSQPAISKHLKVLERAGLVSRGRDAQRRPCRIEARALAEADAWLENYRRIWEANFQRLDDLLDELKTQEKKDKRAKR